MTRPTPKTKNKKKGYAIYAKTKYKSELRLLPQSSYALLFLQDLGLARHQEVFEDLLWADPATDEQGLGDDGFTPNVTRGVSVQYGLAALRAFLDRSGFALLLRAHEVQSRGFRVCKSERVVTVFTSSHYCGSDNLAGVALVTQGVVRAVMRGDVGTLEMY